MKSSSMTAGILLGIIGLAAVVPSASAAEKCFGEPARVVSTSGPVKVRHGQNLVLKNRKRVSVQAAGANLICASRSPVDLVLGGGGSSKVKLGPGDDKVKLVGKIKRKERRTLWTGLGNDSVNVTGRGHTITHLSPRKVKRGARDRDTYSGNEDIDTVYDWGGGTNEKPNLIKGNRALDYLHSAGTARSDIHGGDGTDFLYATGTGDGRDRLFGDRGNDRLNAKGGGKRSNGVYMDGAEGDDWYYGSAGPDTMISLSGVKKLYGNGGDDTIIRSAIGASTILGGPGWDTLSYMGQTPPGWRPRNSGVFVELGGYRGKVGHAVASNKGEDLKIVSIEHLVGSAFDDTIYGRKGNIWLDGGPGDDQIVSYKGNSGDGGLGRNSCGGMLGSTWLNCSSEDPIQPKPDEVTIELPGNGVPVILGSENDDKIHLTYSLGEGAFIVETSSKALVSGSCSATASPDTYSCPVDPDELTIAVIHGGAGDDQVTLSSIPEHMNVIIDGAGGKDRIRGADSREVTFNTERGNLGKGNDQIWMSEDSTLNAGPGSDTVHMTEMCVGGNVKGGPGIRDGIVFAGLKRGVWASMAARKARFLEGPCPKPFRFADDWEGLEGTREDDVLIGAKDRGITFLGRDGIDVFKAKNGKYDKITVGGEGKRNKVIADPKDRILWDWGYAAY